MRHLGEPDDQLQAPAVPYFDGTRNLESRRTVQGRLGTTANQIAGKVRGVQRRHRKGMSKAQSSVAGTWVLGKTGRRTSGEATAAAGVQRCSHCSAYEDRSHSKTHA